MMKLPASIEIDLQHMTEQDADKTPVSYPDDRTIGIAAGPVIQGMHDTSAELDQGFAPSGSRSCRIGPPAQQGIRVISLNLNGGHAFPFAQRKFAQPRVLLNGK